jgi:hypothetical protein
MGFDATRVVGRIAKAAVACAERGEDIITVTIRRHDTGTPYSVRVGFWRGEQSRFAAFFGPSEGLEDWALANLFLEAARRRLRLHV